MFKWSLPWKLSCLVFLAKSVISLLQFWKHLVTFHWFVAFSLLSSSLTEWFWFFAPSWSEVLVQTMRRPVAHIWRQKLCVKLNGGKIKLHARVAKTLELCLFSIISCFVFASFIYLLPRRKRIKSFHFQPFFPQNLSFPAFSIYSQSLEYELITGDHRTNQIAWNRITIGLYLIIGHIHTGIYEHLTSS